MPSPNTTEPGTVDAASYPQNEFDSDKVQSSDNEQRTVREEYHETNAEKARKENAARGERKEQHGVLWTLPRGCREGSTAIRRR